MYRETNTKTVAVNLNYLKEFISIPTWEGDRLLRKSRWERHLSKIKTGLFFSPSWAVAWHKGIQYRLNGNHTSKALIEAYKEGIFPKNLNAVMHTFECDTLEDVALLWAQFDSGNSVRTGNEVVHAAIRIHNDLGHVSQTSASYIASGISWALNKGMEKGISPEDKQQYIHAHKDFVIWANQFAGSRIFKRGAIMGAMYKTWKVDPDAATEFWTLVRDASHPDHKNCTRLLHDFFREATHRAIGSKLTLKCPSLGFYTKTILAWNAWRTGGTTDLKFYEKAYVDENGKTKELAVPK